jgi:hypothetical protein
VQVATEAELRARLAAAKAGGAYAWLLKLDRAMQADQVPTLDLFRKFDADGSGSLGVDEVARANLGASCGVARS